MRKKRRRGPIPIRGEDANDRLHGEFRIQLDTDGGLTIKHDETGLRLSVIARGGQPKIIWVEAYSYWGDEVLLHPNATNPKHPVTGYTVHANPDA